MNRKRKACTYKRYMTKDEAYIAQRRLWKEGQFLRTYKCGYCHGWHVAKHKEKRFEVLFRTIEEQLGIKSLGQGSLTGKTGA
jgi:hypothetical protein